jgi:hypothetical protein
VSGHPIEGGSCTVTRSTVEGRSGPLRGGESRWRPRPFSLERLIGPWTQPIVSFRRLLKWRPTRTHKSCGPCLHFQPRWRRWGHCTLRGSWTRDDFGCPEFLRRDTIIDVEAQQ